MMINGSHNQGQKTGIVLINKKKRTCHLVDFVVPGDHRIEMKEDKKLVKYPNLARE